MKNVPRLIGWRRALALAGPFGIVAASLGGGGAIVGATTPDDTEGGEEATGELIPVDLALSTTSVFGYGYHIAKNLGFYEEEGYDVSLQGTGGSSDVAQILAAGNAEAGMGVPGAMLPVIASGAELYPFFTYAYGEIFDVVVPEGSEFTDIASLEGETIGISALSGGEVPLLRALLVEAGLDPDADVEIVAVGADAPTIRLSLDRGTIAAYAGAKADIATMTAVGVALTSVAPTTLASLPAEGLLATAETRDDADLLAALGRATARGQLVAYTNFDAAVCVLKEEIPAEFTDDAAGRGSLESVIEITTAPEGPDGTYQFGVLDAEGWNTYVEIFLQGGVLEEPIDMSEFVIDEHVEAFNDFDQQETVDLANSLPTDC